MGACSAKLKQSKFKICQDNKATDPTKSSESHNKDKKHEYPNNIPVDILDDSGALRVFR